MTQAHERTATLSELVAEEVRALMARRQMSGRTLATKLAVSPSWVSYRLSGKQPIDVNDMLLIANALSVGVHDLLPSPEIAAKARGPQASAHYLGVPERTSDHLHRPPARPRASRPNGQVAAAGPGRSAHLPRVNRKKRDR
jgi:transcriptional regulator with XRE-family HTH domain